MKNADQIVAQLMMGIALGGLLSIALTLAGCSDPGFERVDKVESGTQVVATPPTPAQAEPPREVTPEPPREVTYEEAEKAYTEKRYTDAVDLFTRYTDRKPDNPWGHYMLGLSAMKSGASETAEKAFEQALALDRKHVKSWLNLSRVLLETERPEDALEKLDHVFELDPESNVAYRLQGRALHQVGDLEGSVSAYREAILIDSADAWSMNNMSLVLIEQQRFDEAVAVLARAVHLKDDVAIFQNNLGIALENTGQFRAAEQAYEAAVEIDGSYERAFANLTRVQIVVEDSSVVPVDLAALSERFSDLIADWPEAASRIDNRAAAVDLPRSDSSTVAITETDKIVDEAPK